MSDRSLYLRAAEDLRANEGQWEAYNSTGHCVVLAGPGSGKTKTLTLKLARMLWEEIEEPRGLACITYNNECARELEQRLQGLGIDPDGRVFAGTMHSFSLTQIILPYAKVAELGLPEDFRVATRQQQEAAFTEAFREIIGGRGDPSGSRFSMDLYRRSILNRDSAEWRERDPQRAALVEEYEQRLRNRDLIDFDDMPLIAVRALREHEWIQRALLAKYPVLAVDEYQDLGRALHRMVLGLCFSAGLRLFAVGDVDQSIYGFTGAFPELLQQLGEREDVQTVGLQLNYRCGSRIVTASEYALGASRGYQAPDGAPEGQVFFHPQSGTVESRAENLFAALIPEIRERIPDLRLGDIAILYPAAFVGDVISDTARRHGIGTIRTDTNAIYPRSSRVMRWLEQCSAWCCDGWRTGRPRFSRLCAEARRIVPEAFNSENDEIEFRRKLLRSLWAQRESTALLHTWMSAIKSEMLDDLFALSRTLDDEALIVTGFIARIATEGDLEGMTLGLFSGIGTGVDRIALSTLHSSKGREFRVVILFGMDAGRIPRSSASEREVLESRRLFYVGFTRAKTEVHMIYAAAQPSPFVREVQDRIG